MSTVSVIVPVYNAAPYLKRCVDSILKQSYYKIQIILVNDGSSDESAIICNEYAKIYSNVQVINKKNGGVSSARNCGLSYVKGDWVFFCDSDDTLPDDSILNMMAKTSQDVDCVVGGYNEIDINNAITYSSSVKSYELPISFKDGLFDIYSPKYLKYNGFLWNRLFRAAVIRSHNLRFNEDIHYREDGLFIIEFLCASRKDINCFSTPVYNYHINPMGAMMTLGQSFPEKFITELDSRILSNASIKEVSGICAYRLRLKAKASVIEGYDWIISLMGKYSYQNDEKKQEMYKKTIHAVSRPFYYIFRMYKLIRRLI